MRRKTGLMQSRTAVVTLAFALMAVAPATARIDVGAETTATVPDPLAPPPILGDGSTVDPALDGGPALTNVVPADALTDATRLVDDTTGIALAVDAEAGPLAVSAGTGEAPMTDPPTFGDRAAAVAVPAVGAGLVAVGFGSLAFGLDGLRSLQHRVAALAGRGLRTLGGLLGLGALPLFSRIQRDGVLDNPVRARVHDLVTQEPGLSLSEVASHAGIAWGTSVHHLRRLESHGLIVSVRERSHRRFFAVNTPAAAQRRQMAVVMHPTARRIAEFVAQRPGTDQAGICQALGLNNPAASKHLGHFESQGLVLSQRSGRSRLYHATGGLHSALQLLEPAPAFTAGRRSSTTTAANVPMLAVA